MAGMYVHSRVIWQMARDAKNRAVAAAVTDDPTKIQPDAVVAIIMSVAATEAFINELGELVNIDSPLFTAQSRDSAETLKSLGATYKEIERSRGSIELKYLVASQILSGKMFKKGEPPFQDFSTLIDLRNDLIHLKPQDRYTKTVDGSEVATPPRYIIGLQQRRLARSFVDRESSWFHIIQTPEIAAWSCDTALAIIRAVIDLLPADPVLATGWILKHAFQFGDGETLTSGQIKTFGEDSAEITFSMPPLSTVQIEIQPPA